MNYLSFVIFKDLPITLFDCSLYNLHLLIYMINKEMFKVSNPLGSKVCVASL